MKKQFPVFIYALTDSKQSEIIRYIGSAKNIKYRLNAHLSLKDGSREKNAWLRSLLQLKKMPYLFILAQCTIEARNIIENNLIETYKSEYLLNFSNNSENLFKNTKVI